MAPLRVGVQGLGKKERGSSSTIHMNATVREHAELNHAFHNMKRGVIEN